jgi:hypothetical protein
MLTARIGKRSNEILDCNASQAVIKEAVAVGQPTKVFTLTSGHGARWTQSPRLPQRLTCETITFLAPERAKIEPVHWFQLKDIDFDKLQFFAEPVDVERTVSIPTLPEALPKFDVTATVEITLKDGSKKTYTKTANIDITK